MNELTIINQNGQLVVDSRDVAEMLGKPHNDLMKSIRNYIEYLTEGNFSLSEFFIENTYQDVKGEERPLCKIAESGFFDTQG